MEIAHTDIGLYVNTQRNLTTPIRRTDELGLYRTDERSHHYVIEKIGLEKYCPASAKVKVQFQL